MSGSRLSHVTTFNVKTAVGSRRLGDYSPFAFKHPVNSTTSWGTRPLGHSQHDPIVRRRHTLWRNRDWLGARRHITDSVETATQPRLAGGHRHPFFGRLEGPFCTPSVVVMHHSESPVD